VGVGSFFFLKPDMFHPRRYLSKRMRGRGTLNARLSRKHVRSALFTKCYNPPMTSRPILYRIHAIQRMFERRVSEENVRRVLQSGEMIEDYSEEMPYPGNLMFGRRGVRPLHVVMAENTKEDELVVITVYEPDRSQWKSGFRSRKK
jgi:hypothetical protein